MNFIKKIRIEIGDFILRMQLKKLKRKKSTFNLETAKTAGVILNASNQTSYEETREFVEFLRKKNIKVYALGFVENFEVLEFFNSHKDFRFFSRKNINWYYKPKSPIVEKFISIEFDILFDLSLKDYFPIKYIVAHSKSKFKIGKISEYKFEYHDFILKFEKDKDVKYFIKQIKFYFKLIKPI